MLRRARLGRHLHERPKMVEEAMIEIRMQGPGKNSIGVAMLDFLAERLREAGGRPVLLTGTGDAFSAGLNLKELVRLDAGGMESFLRRLEAVVAALYSYPGPTVALVNGHAIAGGCVLALCCDHRVAPPDPHMRIGLNEVSLGVQFPPRILRLVLERTAPQHHAEILLGAGLHAPAEALRLGLVDELSADAEAVARKRLAALGALPAAAYAATKQALRGAGMERPDDAARLRQMVAEWTSPQVRQRFEAALCRPGS